MNVEQEISKQEVKGIVERIKESASTTPDTSKVYRELQQILPNNFSTQTKADSFSGYTFKDLQEANSKGIYVNKYDKFDTTKSIEFNQEVLAKEQTSGDKWANGLKKFGGKTLTAVAGGTVGSVIGLFDMMKTGSMTSLYDNSFAKSMEDLNVKMDYKLPNYYSQAEKDLGIFSQMGTANFWANDFLGGLSFTVGAIASEAIWAAATGGASLSTATAKLGAQISAKAYAKSLAKSLLKSGIKEGTEVVAETAVKRGLTTGFGRAGSLLNTARFTYTSAGYESSVESLAYLKEMREAFEYDFEKKNGRKATYDEYNEFNKNLVDGANSVFFTNLALVGSSNLATFGKVFNIARPTTGLSKIANKNLFGIGLDKTGKEVIKATRAQKIAGGLYSFLKPAVVEGVYEEGGQSVANKTFSNFVKATYDPKYVENSYSLSSAFADGLEETFTTKEGWKEIWLGMLIGVVGGKGSDIISKRGGLSEARNNAKEMAEFNKNYSSESIAKGFLGTQKVVEAEIGSKSTNEAIHEALKFSNRVQSANDMDSSSNTETSIQSTLSSSKSATAQFTYAYNLDQFNDTVNETVESMLAVSNEDIAESLGIDVSEAESYKNKMVEEYRALSKEYKKNREFVDYYLGDKIRGKSSVQTKLIKEAAAFSLTTGKQVLTQSENIFNDILDRVGDVGNIRGGLETFRTLSQLSEEAKEELETFRIELTEVSSELDEKMGKLKSLEATEENAKELEDLSKEVEVLKTKENNIVNKLNILTSSVPIETTGGRLNTNRVITKDDFLNLESNLKELEKHISELRKFDGIEADYLVQLTIDYKEHLKAFKEFSDINRLIASGDLNLSSKTNVIGKLLSDESFNEMEAEFLDVLGNAVGERLQDYIENNATLREKIEEIRRNREKQNSEEEVEIKYENSLQALIANSPFLQGRFTEDELKEAFENESLEDEYLDLMVKAEQDPNFEADLTNLSDNTVLTEQEKERLNELATMLGTLQISEGFNNEGISLKDILEQYKQLKKAESLEETEHVTVDSAEYQEIAETGEKEIKDGELRREEITQTPKNVQVSFGKNSVSIHNLTMSGFLENLKFESLQILEGKENKEVEADGKEIPERTKLKVNFKDSSFVLYKNPRGGVTITHSSKNRNKSFLDILRENSKYDVIKYSKGITSKYSFLYLGENAMESDYQIDSRYNTDAIYSTRVGDFLKFEVNADDVFNKTLEGKTDEEIVKLVKIHVVDSKGNVVGELKSEDGTYGHDFFNMLRLEASRVLGEGGGILDYEVPVKKVFLGTLNMVIDSDGKLVLQKPDENMVDDFGYLENKKLQLNLKTSDSFVDTSLLNKYGDKKVPVVVVKQGERRVAIPVQLDYVPSNQGEFYKEYFENSNDNTAKMVIEFNEELMKKGYKTNLYFKSPTEQNIYNADGGLSNEFQKAVDFLNSIPSEIDLLRITKEEFLSISNLPLDNNKDRLISPKIVLDYDGAIKVSKISSEETQAEETEQVNKSVDEKIPEPETETKPKPKTKPTPKTKPKTKPKKEEVENKKEEEYKKELAEKKGKEKTLSDKVEERKKEVEKVKPEPAKIVVKPKPKTKKINVEIPEGVRFEESDITYDFFLPSIEEGGEGVTNFMYNSILEEGDSIYPKNHTEIFTFSKGKIVPKFSQGAPLEVENGRVIFREGVQISKIKGSSKALKKKETIKVSNILREESNKEQNKNCK